MPLCMQWDKEPLKRPEAIVQRVQKELRLLRGIPSLRFGMQGGSPRPGRSLPNARERPRLAACLRAADPDD